MPQIRNQSNVPANRTVVITALIATILFLLIAADVVYGGGLTSLDFRINNWLHSHRTPGLITFFVWVGRLHSSPFIIAATVAICVYLWSRRLRRWVLMIGISALGGMLLNVVLKLMFARARPHFDDPIVILRTFSFPSGHAMTATVFYGALCLLAIFRVVEWKSRALFVLPCLLMIALVGFSRMYLGAHYLTDVIGALFEGIAWVSLSLIIAGVVRKEQRV